MQQLEIRDIARESIDTEYFPNTRTSGSAESYESLKRSIKADGLAVPPTVWVFEHTDEATGETYPVHALIAGFRRMKAIKEIVAEEGNEGLFEFLSCAVFTGTFEDALAFNIKENVQREDLAPMDAAAAVVQLMDMYGNQTKVGEVLQMSQAWVSNFYALGRYLCERAKLAVASNMITLAQAGQLTKMLLGSKTEGFRPDVERQESFLDKLVKGGAVPKEPGKKVRSIRSKEDFVALHRLLYADQVVEQMDAQQRSVLLKMLAWYNCEVEAEVLLEVIDAEDIPAKPDWMSEKPAKAEKTEEEKAAEAEARAQEAAAKKAAKLAEREAAKKEAAEQKAAEKAAAAEAKAAAAAAKAAAKAAKDAAKATTTASVSTGKTLPPSKGQPKATKTTTKK